MAVPSSTSPYVTRARRGDQSAFPENTGRIRKLMPMITSVRNPTVKVCRAASDHQRFCAGSRVVLESTTAAISSSDQRARQPKAQRIATAGSPGRAAREDGLVARGTRSRRGTRARRARRDEVRCPGAEAPARPEGRKPRCHGEEHAHRLGRERHLGRAAPRRCEPEEERHDPVAEPVDPGEEEAVDGRREERARSSRPATPSPRGPRARCPAPRRPPSRARKPESPSRRSGGADPAGRTCPRGPCGAARRRTRRTAPRRPFREPPRAGEGAAGGIEARAAVPKLRAITPDAISQNAVRGGTRLRHRARDARGCGGARDTRSPSGTERRTRGPACGRGSAGARGRRRHPPRSGAG